jgi:hypothetical protein
MLGQASGFVTRASGGQNAENEIPNPARRARPASAKAEAHYFNLGAYGDAIRSHMSLIYNLWLPLLRKG